MTDTNQTGALRTADGPNIRALRQALDDACTHATVEYEKQLLAENVRFCKWPDQQDDGRKPDLVDGKRATPWPGASDVRIRLADEVVNERVRLMKTAARSAKLTVRGTEASDLQRAGKVQIYLDHLRDTKLVDEVAEQNELAAQWRETFAAAVTAITWRQTWERVFDVVTLEQLQQQAQMLPAAAQLLSLIGSPSNDDRKLAASLLRQMYEDLDATEAYKQVQALRTQGEMSLPRRRIAENRPSWTALKLWRDVFFPLNTPGDLQQAQWIAWRMTLTEVQLEEKILSEDWAPEFVEAVKKTVGASVLTELASRTEDSARREVFRDQAEEMAGLHEVFAFYYRTTDDQGVPCVWKTVMSPHVGRKVRSEEADLFGVDEPLGYDHGKLPFIPHRREKLDAMMVEGRGVPEVVNTNQQELKWQRDARTDQTDLNLRPPMIRPEREVGLPLSIEPMGEIGERRMQALRPLNLPAVTPQTQALEADARRDVDRYFARNRAENPVGAGIAEQDLATDWCAELAAGWRMTLQLAQQFESAVEFQRVVGGKSVPFQVSREEIQGQHDIRLFFNTDTLDPEKMKAKVEVVQKMLAPLDRGTIDWAPVVRGLFAYYLPEFADLALRDDQQTTQAEIKDEQNNWNLMLGGTEPEMMEQGQNFPLRLMWLEQKSQEPGAMARLSQLPDSEQLVQRRIEHLRFMVQQNQVNAQTGRVGVAPMAAAAGNR